jgi:transcriptional regulator with XRE-family HTH domain
MVETIGKRIAYLRQQHGWTQQSLADRLAMSRVAISHIEMDLTIPSERSITLMAGTFKLSPMELIQDTTYPRAKAERLPDVTNLYTELELQLELLRSDLEWLHRLDDSLQKRKYFHEVLEKWSPRLEEWNRRVLDDRERTIIEKMSGILDDLKAKLYHLLT